tara:strand:- start:731 stop:1174 length:444 start_codon:yes stop_codon:yes gene_type:complete
VIVNQILDVTIEGEAASAKNQRRIVLIGGKPRLIKSAKALAYAESFALQFPPCEISESDVVVWLDCWYASRRPDLSAADLIHDLLQSRIIKNDRQIKGSTSLWNLDKEKPRVRIRVAEITLPPGTTVGSQGLSSFEPQRIWAPMMSG